MTEVDGHSDGSDTDGDETELDRLWQEVPRHSYLGEVQWMQLEPYVPRVGPVTLPWFGLNSKELLVFPGAHIPFNIPRHLDALLETCLHQPGPLKGLIALSLNTDLGIRIGPCTCPECFIPPGCIARVIGVVPSSSRGLFEVVQRCGIMEATPWVPNISGMARATVKPLVDAPETPRAVAEGLTAWPSELFDPFGAECLITDLRDMMQRPRRDLKVPLDYRDDSFDTISNWLANNLPMSYDIQSSAFSATSVADRMRNVMESLEYKWEPLCARCNHKLIRDASLICLSPDGTTQWFVNPAHIHLPITWLKGELNVEVSDDPPDTNYSWIPGYGWRHISCPSCYLMLGWNFVKAGRNHDDGVQLWGVMRDAMKWQWISSIFDRRFTGA